MTDCFHVVFRQKKDLEQIEGLQSEFFFWVGGVKCVYNNPLGVGKKAKFNGLEPKLPPF